MPYPRWARHHVWVAPQLKRPIAVAVALLALVGCTAKPALKTVDQVPVLMEAFRVDGLALAAVQDDQIVVAAGFGVNAAGEPYTANTHCELFSA
ncbi:MAG: hypothetical protein AAGJ86_07720, partial [Pseudomonadota bacterium]